MTDPLVLSAGHQLRDQAHALAEATVALEFSRHPQLRVRYGPAGRVKSREDSVCHFCFLADALDFNSPALFKDYIGWAKAMLESRGVLGEDLDHHLVCMADALRRHMPPPVAAPAAALLEGVRAELPAMPTATESFLDPDERLFPLAREYVHVLLSGYRAAASRLVLDAAERGEPVCELYLQVFQPALREIGRLWQVNKINVAQEHFCSAATEMLMSQLMPPAWPAERCGHRIVVVCIGGELHELGARMVADFFDMAGWDTYFSGANTPQAAVVQTIAKQAADVLAISVTMGHQLHRVQALIEQLRTDARCAGLRVMVGGHPFAVDPALWRAVGADGTAADAEGAVALATQWLAPPAPARQKP